MLTEIYIEALLVDEEMADQVLEAWEARQVDEFVACLLWLAVVSQTHARKYRKSTRIDF